MTAIKKPEPKPKATTTRSKTTASSKTLKMELPPTQEIPEPPPVPATPHRIPESAVQIMRHVISGEILQSVSTMDTTDLMRMQYFVKVLNNNRGCTTAAEDLIVDLVDQYEKGITPEFVENQLDPQNTNGFRSNFDEALKTAKEFQARYSGLMKPAGGAE